MNTYTVEFKYTKSMVKADDMDSAVWAAEAACTMSAEDRGPLWSVTLHSTYSEEKFLTAACMEAEPFQSGKPMPKLAEIPQPGKLPSRRQRGLTLSYSDGDLMVISFGYSASLACAFHEEELNHDAGRHEPKQLGHEQMQVVCEWLDREADFFEQNGWKTWGEING